MVNKYIERFIGDYCKSVIKKSDADMANVIIGVLENVDYEDGFIILDSWNGKKYLHISNIVAVKHKIK